MKENNTYYTFTITVFIILLIPSLVQDGMFLDGITYSAISKNMANGLGSIWEPHYTKMLYSNFHEHPPLVFVLQSLFFKLLGHAFYTERIYCFITAMLSLIGIAKCWRLFFDKNKQKQCDWLPVLLWLTIPLVSWSYNNNILENTMAVFTTFAVFCILKSLIEKKIIYLFLGSFLIISAFLSKGFVGLFPVVVPWLYAIVYKEGRTPMFYAMYLLFSVTGMAYIIAIAFPELKNNIALYLDQQLIPALNNKREITTENRFSIVFKLILEISLPILLLVFVIMKQWVKERTIGILKNKTALLYLLIALSASIPLMITLKQRKFYLIPSIPFYILSVSFWIYPFFMATIEKISSSTLIWMKRISIIVLSGVFIFSIVQFGKISRDEEKLKDVYMISQNVPEGTVLTTTKQLWSDWGLVAYMCRVGYLSLDCDNEHEYYLTEKNKHIENTVRKRYRIMDLKLNKYVILKRTY